MQRFAALTGRAYRLFEYFGPDDPERVLVLMGSGAETVRETIDALNDAATSSGWSRSTCSGLSPRRTCSTRSPPRLRRSGSIARRNRGAGEPLYQDVVTAFAEGASSAAWRRCRGSPRTLRPRVEGVHAGDGQGSVRQSHGACAEEPLRRRHRRRCLGWYEPGGGPRVRHRERGSRRLHFHGLGADGTVGANKNSIKIIGEASPDTRRPSSTTRRNRTCTPHTRASDQSRSGRPISFRRLVSSPAISSTCWNVSTCSPRPTTGRCSDHPPVRARRRVGSPATAAYNEKSSASGSACSSSTPKSATPARPADQYGHADVFLRNIGRAATRGGDLSRIKQAVRDHGRKGTKLVDQNFAAIDRALDNLHEVDLSARIISATAASPVVPDHAPSSSGT